MIHHLKEQIEYAKDQLAWLESGAPEGKEPWRDWQVGSEDGHWEPCALTPCFNPKGYYYRRRPKLLHAIDAKGIRHEWPEPMREVPEDGAQYWLADVTLNRVFYDYWGATLIDRQRHKAGECHHTKEAAEAHLAALRAVCRGGVDG